MSDGKPEPIGREFSVTVFGITSRDHPINDEIFDAVHAIGEKHGVDIGAGSGPYFEEGNAADRKLAEVTTERDRVRAALEFVLSQFQQAKQRDGVTHDAYYRGHLDFPQMDAARNALGGEGRD